MRETAGDDPALAERAATIVQRAETDGCDLRPILTGE
jgi:hypothetical protein